MQIPLEHVKDEYNRRIQDICAGGAALTPSGAIELFARLFHEVKAEGVSPGEFGDGDALLYEYGVYDWRDEWGAHFSFGITRQFCAPGEDEPYQLSLTLAYEPDEFRRLGSYMSWSMDYADMDSFVAHIKATEGFRAVQGLTPRDFRLWFEQC